MPLSAFSLLIIEANKMIKTQEKDKTDKVPEEINTRRQSTTITFKMLEKKHQQTRI